MEYLKRLFPIVLLLVVLVVAYNVLGGNQEESDYYPLRYQFVSDTLNFPVTFLEDLVRLEVSKSEVYELPLVPSASGSKYSNGQVTFWTKGEEATFIINDQDHFGKIEKVD